MASRNFGAVVIDDHEAVEYLQKLNEEGVTKIIRKGLTAGAGIFRKAIQADAPVKQRESAGKHGTFKIRGKLRDYGTPGMLKGSVKAARIRHSPAIGVVVGPMGKGAFTRHWVVRGTKAHVIPIRIHGRTENIPHPGSRADPFVDRGVSAVESAAVALAEQVILTEAQNL